MLCSQVAQMYTRKSQNEQQQQQHTMKFHSRLTHTFFCNYIVNIEAATATVPTVRSRAKDGNK